MFDLKKQKYDISFELKVRKLLEKNTNSLMMFIKSDDKYEYDLEIYKYKIDNSGYYEKIFVGYIEIEKNVGGWIDTWHEISFLKRKLYNFNAGWITVKENADKTFYLKFSNDNQDCFGILISDVIKYGSESHRSRGGYNNSYIVLKKDHPSIKYSIKNCIQYIERI